MYFGMIAYIGALVRDIKTIFDQLDRNKSSHLYDYIVPMKNVVQLYAKITE